MRILLWAVVIALTFYSNNTVAQTCSTIPDCSSLGYIKTASQCSGRTYTVCPFDTSKYSCDTTTCEELGYTQTASDCSGRTYTVCPFDTTKYSCDTTSCEDLGFNQNITECNDYNYVRCPFDKTNDKKVFCANFVSKDCNVDDPLYDNLKCYEEGRVPDGRVPIAIVFDVENRLAVALKDIKGSPSWGGYGSYVPNINSCVSGSCSVSSYSDVTTNCVTNSDTTGGKYATKYLVEYGKSNNITFYAAKYCYEWTEGNQPAGSWFLPMLGDAVKISYNIEESELTKYGGTMFGDGHYWTAHDLDNYKACKASLIGSLATSTSDKYSSGNLRCIIMY